MSNIQLRLKEIGFDNKYVKLIVVCLKHIQIISAITEIWPVSFNAWLMNVHHMSFMQRAYVKSVQSKWREI